MFNIVEKNQKLVKVIMIIVVSSFVLWGIGGYLGGAINDGFVAKVGSLKIYPRDIDQAMEQNPQNTDKMQILFGLINRQLLINHINTYSMVPSDTQLQRQIASISAFQNSEKQFDIKKYQNFLREKFISATQFENNIGQQILVNEFLDVFKNSYFSSNLFDKNFAKLLSRERNIARYIISPHDFYAKINPTEQQIKDYYSQNAIKFTDPEKAKVQYIVLNTSTVAKNIKISDEDIQKYITSHKANLTDNQIDASHILFSIPKDATSQAKEAIKAKAQKILVEARQNPAKFSELAKQYSQDPGSSVKGGDLGYFGKGVMVKQFEEVAFKLKLGQISDLVETQYGFHIIKLNAIKNSTPEELKKLAIAQLQKQQTSGLIQKSLEQLNEITYNNPSSLEPAAKKLGLAIQTSNGFINKGAVSGDFANPKIQKAIFNQDVITHNNNSEVVDLGDDSYAVYHVTEYAKPKLHDLDEVKTQITEQIKASLATNMANTDGNKKIADLRRGSINNLVFTNPEYISLLGQSKNIDSNAIKQIFATSLSKRPAYTGSIDSKGNFVIYKILEERVNDQLDTQNEKIVQQIEASDAMLAFGAYLGSLRNLYSVSYKIEQLTKQSNSNDN